MRAFVSSVVICLLALAAAPPASANPAHNVVTQWATHVQQSIHNAGAPRSAGTSQALHTMVMLAIYDAVMAIDGGYEPYAARIAAPLGADVGAAVATAAYLTARPRLVPAEAARLADIYATFMAAIADGPAKTGGIQVGEAAAAAMLARRANDGFGATVSYWCSATPPPPGEFVPDTGCPASAAAPQPVDVKVAFIKPFTYNDPGRYRPDGPNPVTSSAYTEDFVETRDYGRIDSTVRTAEQTDVAYFWAEHPYVHWSRNLVALAASQNSTCPRPRASWRWCTPLPPMRSSRALPRSTHTPRRVPGPRFRRPTLTANPRPTPIPPGVRSSA